MPAVFHESADLLTDSNVQVLYERRDAGPVLRFCLGLVMPPFHGGSYVAAGIFDTESAIISVSQLTDHGNRLQVGADMDKHVREREHPDMALDPVAARVALFNGLTELIYERTSPLN